MTTIKVKDLIAILERCDKNATVLLSSDEEGNTLSPYDGIAFGTFEQEKTSVYTVLDSIYTMEPDEIKGKYVILYPR